MDRPPPQCAGVREWRPGTHATRPRTTGMVTETVAQSCCWRRVSGRALKPSVHKWNLMTIYGFTVIRFQNTPANWMHASPLTSTMIEEIVYASKSQSVCVYSSHFPAYMRYSDYCVFSRHIEIVFEARGTQEGRFEGPNGCGNCYLTGWCGKSSSLGPYGHLPKCITISSGQTRTTHLLLFQRICA